MLKMSILQFHRSLQLRARSISGTQCSNWQDTIKGIYCGWGPSDAKIQNYLTAQVNLWESTLRKKTPKIVYNGLPYLNRNINYMIQTTGGSCMKYMQIRSSKFIYCWDKHRQFLDIINSCNVGWIFTRVHVEFLAPMRVFRSEFTLALLHES